MGKQKNGKHSTSEMEEASEDDGRGSHQRPNCCDTTIMSMMCFFMIIALAAGIPIILASKGIGIDLLEKFETIQEDQST
ncbi:Col_cuticle_N domain-containing protein [Caenorhabditis elegans]|uniref:Col_cuticle_N domain-containing protein n=1 Tax=Caenorhabditis elegans TaxID=6239 RepID=Q21245_CAEEL|nr:Col_cuticle_N domain-containing protein [Caenorhabditis elegans]CCD69147.1 Col_cuticle_N domain-containing protein [Caenorhabditis elegans]|eukprot:NP_495145.1 Uncharacterized protein CELE_K05F1.8 [Caenorhabditis elegans]